MSELRIWQIRYHPLFPVATVITSAYKSFNANIEAQGALIFKGVDDEVKNIDFKGCYVADRMEDHQLEEVCIPLLGEQILYLAKTELFKHFTDKGKEFLLLNAQEEEEIERGDFWGALRKLAVDERFVKCLEKVASEYRNPELSKLSDELSTMCNWYPSEKLHRMRGN